MLGDAPDRWGTEAEGLRLCFIVPVLEEGGKGIDGDWEDRRGVRPGGNFNQGLQVTELQGSRIPADHVSGIGQALRRFEFTLRMDDFGSPLTFRLGLLGDHALHLLGEVHVFHLDRRDLHAPRFCLLVKDELELTIDLFPLGQQIIKLTLTEDTAERGLGHHRRRMEVVLNLDNRSLLVDDTEINDGVDLHRHVIPGDDVLRRYVQGHGSQTDADHPIDEGHDDDETRTVATIEASRNATEPEDHGSFVFREDVDAQLDDDDHKDGDQQEPDRSEFHD
jgi:hypothetical protein